MTTLSISMGLRNHRIQSENNSMNTFRKIYISSFLIQFLVWIQLSASQLVCQCDHSASDAACHTADVQNSPENCSAGNTPGEEQPSQTAESCHQNQASTPAAETTSCCVSEDASPETGEPHAVSAQFCNTVCLTIIFQQSQFSSLPKQPLKLSLSAVFAGPAVKQPLLTPNPAPVLFQTSGYHLHSPPLFLLHSVFLI